MVTKCIQFYFFNTLNAKKIQKVCMFSNEKKTIVEGAALPPF